MAPSGPTSGALDGGLDVGLDEVRWDVDARGRLTTRSRWVVRVTSQRGVEAIQVVVADWRPWFEERPTLEAWVLTPDGQRVALDPTVITVQPALRDGDLYTDARELHAPLPRLSVGAIADIRVVTRERRAPFRSARRVDDELGDTGPCRLRRRVVQAAPGVDLTWEVVGGAAPLPPPSRTEPPRGGLRLTWERRDDPGLGVFPPATGREAWPVPVLRWSAHVRRESGGGWTDAAAEYAATVEGRLARAELGPLAARVVGNTRDTREAARRVMTFVREHLRYTGLELGDAAYVPAPPAKVLERGHGDCKDLATLVVGLLRTRGFSAHVALLETREGPALTPKVAGLEAFDHAIVFVDARHGGAQADQPTRRGAETPPPARSVGGAHPAPGGDDHGGGVGGHDDGAGGGDEGGPLWLDPTAPEYAVGSLPPEDRGRMALVARPRPPRRTARVGTTPSPPALLRTPDRETDHYRERRLLTLRPLGPSRAALEVQAWGDHAATIRRALREDPTGYRRAWAREARRLFQAAQDEPADVTVRGPRATPQRLDLDPITVRVTLDHAGLGAMDEQHARLELPTASVFDALPDALAGVPSDDPAENAWQRARWLRRGLPVDLGARDVREIRWLVRWPQGAELLGGAHASDGFALGPPGAARYSLEVEPTDDRELRVAAQFSVGAAPLPAPEAERLARLVGGRLDAPAPSVEVALAPWRSWSQGGTMAREDALRRWRELARAHPEEPAYALAFAQGVASLGLPEGARELVERALARAPTDPAIRRLAQRLQADAPPSPLAEPKAPSPRVETGSEPGAAALEKLPSPEARARAAREQSLAAADRGDWRESVRWALRQAREVAGPEGLRVPGTSDLAWGWYGLALHGLLRGGQEDEAVWLARTVLGWSGATGPGSCRGAVSCGVWRASLGAQRDVAAARGDWGEALRLAEKVALAEGVGEGTRRWTWLAVASEGPSRGAPGVPRSARTAGPPRTNPLQLAGLSPTGTPTELALAALVGAASGRVVEPATLSRRLLAEKRGKRESGWSSRDAELFGAPRARDVALLAMGRVAQTLGLPETARAYYGGIDPPRRPRADSVYAVARRWMRALAAAGPVQETAP